MNRTSLILQQIGQAIWPEEWRKPLALRLAVSERSMRDWMQRDSMPPGVVAELGTIARTEGDALEKRAKILQGMAGALASQSLPAAETVPAVTSPSGVLHNFRVIPTGVWDDPEIRFEHDGDLVLAMVTREAWDDFFRLPGDFHLTSNEARMLSQTNLVRLAPVIAQHYWAGRCNMIQRAGGNYPLIILKEEDLRRAGPGMSKDILDQVRAAGPRQRTS